MHASRRSPARPSLLSRLGAVLVTLAAGVPLAAQSNAVPGTDVLVPELGDITVLGRTGTFPNGFNGIAIQTIACNVGTQTVAWLHPDSTTPMNDDHPWIGTLIVREEGGRLIQISDRSYVKSGVNVFSGNVCGECSNCPGGQCSFLAPGCSDTYKVGINGNNYYLAPPDEIDPFLGVWDPFGSHFDQGEPPVAPPSNTDGVRSLTQSMVNNMGPIGHRVRVSDEALNHGGADYWFQAYYVIQGEPEAERENNLASQRFLPTWLGAEWNLSHTGPVENGSVLHRWSGAEVSSNTNGGDDGRVYVGVRVTGPDAEGLFHYEYALHNRDNARGVAAFRIPLCRNARLRGFGFHDVAESPALEWDLTRTGNELVVATTNNPLRWNSIYNLWFDSDAAPTAGSARLDAFDAGPGAPAFAVRTRVPGPPLRSARQVVAGCSFGAPPRLEPEALPASAGPASAGISATSRTLRYRVHGLEPFAGSLLVARLGGEPGASGPCLLPTDGAAGASVRRLGAAVAGGDGVASHTVAVPGDLALEGVEAVLQAIVHRSGGGPVLGRYDLSNGIAVLLGGSARPCR